MLGPGSLAPKVATSAARYTVTEVATAPAMRAEIANLETSAAQQASESPHLAARIRLERALMGRLPEILSGGVTAVEVAYPGGSTALVEAAAEDPLLDGPLAEQLAAVLACYTRNLAQVGSLLTLHTHVLAKCPALKPAGPCQIDFV